MRDGAGSPAHAARDEVRRVGKLGREVSGSRYPWVLEKELGLRLLLRIRRRVLERALQRALAEVDVVLGDAREAAGLQIFRDAPKTLARQNVLGGGEREV